MDKQASGSREHLAPEPCLLESLLPGHPHSFSISRCTLTSTPLPEKHVPSSHRRYWRASPQEQSHTDKSTLWTEPSNDPTQGANSLCAAPFSILPRGYHCAQENHPVHLLVIGGWGRGVSIPAFTLRWKSSGELDYSTSDLSQVPDGL